MREFRNEDTKINYGKCEYTNGDLYEGEWLHEKRHGFGSMVFANSCRYEGSWKNDKMDGKGKLYLPGGEWVFSEFHCGEIYALFK